MVKVSQTKLSKQNYFEYEEILRKIKYSLNLHPIWLESYIDTFGYQANDLLLECREDETDNLIGFLPLVIQSQKDNRFITIRRLIPCGYIPTDFFPFPVIPGKEEEYATAIANWLVDEKGKWDRLFINLIPKEDKAWKLIVGKLKKLNFDVDVSTKYRYLTLDTRGKYEDHLDRLGTKKKKVLRYQERRLEKELGQVHFEIIENDVQHYFNRFIKLYSARRDDAEQSDPFTRVKPLYNFNELIVERYGAKNWIRLSILKCGSTSVAYCYFYYFNHVMYYSMPTYDTKYEKYSPGRVLLAKLIEYAFDDTCIDEFNFMRSEYPYKLWWLPEPKHFVNISIENKKSHRLGLNNFYLSVRKNFQALSRKYDIFLI